MEDQELQKFQKETFPTIVWGTGLLMTLFFVANFYFPENLASLYLPCGLSIATCIVSYQLHKADRFRLATYVLVGGQTLAVVAFLPSSVEQFATFYAYLFLLVISLAGTLINIRAIAGTTIFAIIATLITAVLTAGHEPVKFYLLFIPLAMTMLMALTTWASSYYLTGMAQWSIQNQQKARRRSDELFESQQQLKKAHQFQETTNIRLQEAYGELAQTHSRLQEAEATTRSLYTKEETRRQVVETLYRSSRALSRSLNLAELLIVVLDYLSGIVPHDRSSLMLEKGGELETLAARGFPNQINPLNVKMPIKEGDVFHKIVETMQPLAIDDAAQLSSWQRVEGVPMARAWVGVPLMRLDRVMGMLSIVRETTEPFTQEEIDLASAFAGEAAVAIENALLYDQIVKFSQDLEEMVQMRTEQLRQANTQLERLNQTKSDFIKITAHELRTPLTAIHGYGQMMMRDSGIKANPMWQMYAESIFSGSERLYEIINTMLDVAKLDGNELKIYPKPFSVAYLLKQIGKKFEPFFAERNLTLDIISLDDLPEINADSDALQKVFYHLLINAIKYTPDGGKITVMGYYPPCSQRAGFTQEGIEIVVYDTGIGIDPEYQELIFDKFYQTGEMALHSSGKTKFKGGGPGLGLAIVKGIVEIHHGQVWAESPKHDEVNFPGSHFHVLLPVQYNPN